MADDEVWLTVPQAVVLSATRDVELALGLQDEDPGLLMLKAARILDVRAVIPIEAEATAEQRREAFERLREANRARANENRYLAAERHVRNSLAGGVTVKASRERDGALTVVDPAEFTRLELRGVDAADRRSGKTVFYNLRIAASEFVERLRATDEAAADGHSPLESPGPKRASPEKTTAWTTRGDPLPLVIEWAREKYGDDLSKLPGRGMLLTAFREKFGLVRGVTEKTMREVRRRLAPDKIRRGGAPTHRS